ncbi:MAG: histidine--tRNA ligase [Alphaproteobacteria bacterium]|nr:histidine--tRNA ligase [Alphaproteobacteria bacterium]
MAALQPVRGTHDLLPEQFIRHRAVEETARKITERYGYREVSTPIFEFTKVFSRTLGDTSDVVTKEMYTFCDRNDESMTLRPEGTAGIVRSFISNGLAQNVPVKHFYRGAMFRYERPQKGRQRQFHQVGIEIIGVDTPQADIEVIAAGWDFLSEIGFKDKVKLELNTLGDAESRKAYKDKLVAYLKGHYEQLSKESKERLEKNPLRILDSKEECDKPIIENAPSMANSMNEDSVEFFKEVTDGLTAIGIPFTLNPKLVRGLDYYCHTAFEFTTTELGAQGTVLAGGRYNGLVKQMGGSATTGVGWAAGVERLAMLLEETPEFPRPVTIIPIGEEANKEALKIAHNLRKAGFVIDMGYSGNLKKRMKKANKLNAKAAIILGGDELERSIAIVRNLDNGEQEEVSLNNLEQKIADFAE